MHTPTFLKAKWRYLIMANYPIGTEAIAPYLPYSVQPDLWNGKAYVSLVGFLFQDTRLFGVPIPLLGTFEEVNLRLYVVRQHGNEARRGVVFINETVPYAPVAWLANKLYKEHYTAVKTTRNIREDGNQLHVDFQWQAGNRWNSIGITAIGTPEPMPTNSFEEYIFEHYYGYTAIAPGITEEYTIAHPRWQLYPTINPRIDCDFEATYGAAFACLNHTPPTGVYLAEGSGVAVQWKRQKITAHEHAR